MKISIQTQTQFAFALTFVGIVFCALIVVSYIPLILGYLAQGVLAAVLLYIAFNIICAGLQGRNK